MTPCFLHRISLSPSPSSSSSSSPSPSSYPSPFHLHRLHLHHQRCHLQFHLQFLEGWGIVRFQWTLEVGVSWFVLVLIIDSGLLNHDWFIRCLLFEDHFSLLKYYWILLWIKFLLWLQMALLKKNTIEYMNNSSRNPMKNNKLSFAVQKGKTSISNQKGFFFFWISS